MNIIGWLLLGLVAGVIANAIDPAPSKGGILGAIVLGIVGALVGGFIGSLLLGVDVSGFNIGSILVAVIGSLLVLWIGRALTRESERIV